MSGHHRLHSRVHLVLEAGDTDALDVLTVRHHGRGGWVYIATEDGSFCISAPGDVMAHHLRRLADEVDRAEADARRTAAAIEEVTA